MADINGGDNAHAIAAAALKSYVERIENLEVQKKEYADDIKSVYGEAKAQGYDTKVLKKAIAIRARDKQEVVEEFAILDTYLTALGMEGIFG